MGRGQAAYAPEMMVRLLLHGCARGVYSSRKIQTRTFEEVAFRYLSGDQHPDHATIAEFRKRHLEALSGLFTQALLLCSEAGLVKLGHVSIDGAKLKANASKHKVIVEPVFGQIKEQRVFRRFSLRGKENVSREWKLVCAASNLLKLFRAGGVLEMA